MNLVSLLAWNKNTVYEQYIEALVRDDLARKVKLADLKDNLVLQRLPEFTKTDAERVDRYYRALSTLLRYEQEAQLQTGCACGCACACV